ncbi:unnamed protein product [Cuscuta epithymum]|uniref:Ribosomal protein L34 n=1 Tax=Cuscuta epithymum TaxID=186058 RepID=A0AAV0DS97_9ASTE|nr:unnamed protein product [Cuscuta epithymum]
MPNSSLGLQDRKGKIVQQLVYRSRYSYAMKLNQHRVVKTPGWKLVFQTKNKRSRLSESRRNVNRAYGGVLSGSVVREIIIRAFVVEEEKIVKKVLRIQKTKENQAAKNGSSILPFS